MVVRVVPFTEWWRWTARFRRTGFWVFSWGGNGWILSFGLRCGLRVWRRLSLTLVGVGTFERPRAPCGSPWMLVRFVFVVAVVLAGAAAGETWETLAFEVGDHVPKWGGLVVVAY